MRENDLFPSENHAKLSIFNSFKVVRDPRSATSLNFCHPLSKILFIAVVCILCGSNDWETIVIQANAMQDWLAKFVDMSTGVPSTRTFTRVFSALNPKELNQVLVDISQKIGKKKDGEIIL